MAEIVGLVAQAQQSVIVERPGQEGLPGHMAKVVLEIELKVDFLVVFSSCGWLFAWVSEHKDLKGVLTWFQVDPDRLSRLVFVEVEGFTLILLLLILVCLISLSQV